MLEVQKGGNLHGTVTRESEEGRGSEGGGYRTYKWIRNIMERNRIGGKP